jgi:hypothetical protein
MKEWRSCKIINPKYLEHITCPWMDVEITKVPKEMPKAVIAIIRVFFLSIISSFLFSQSLTAFRVAYWSYLAKWMHLFLSGLEITLMISAIFFVPISPAFQLPQKHLTDHGGLKTRERFFSFSVRLSRFLNSALADSSKEAPLSMLIPNRQKKWQLRHPRLGIFTPALFIGG